MEDFILKYMNKLMKYLKVFESFDEEYYEELLSSEYSVYKFKSLYIPDEGSIISKKGIEEYCGIVTKRQDFDVRYNTTLPGWSSEMGRGRKRTELQISFSVDITNMADKSNIRIAELRDAKLVLDIEIDILLLPEEYFLVRFYSEPKKGNHRYFQGTKIQTSFYKCDQLEGLKCLIDEIYHSYKNKKIKT